MGRKSTGKSTFISNIFPCDDLNIQVKEKISNSCPIEFKFRKNLTKNSFKVIISKDIKQEFETLKKALMYAKKDEYALYNPDYIIEANIKYENNFNIIDLPGYTHSYGAYTYNETNYFGIIKNKYLTNSRTLVIHIRSCIRDSVSYEQYFEDIKSDKIIEVFTRCDGKTSNVDKRSYLNLCASKQKIHKFGLFCREETNIMVLNGLNLTENKDIIVGIPDIKNFILDELKSKTKRIIPMVKPKIDQVISESTKRLKFIGKTKQNPDSIHSNFKDEMCKRLNISFDGYDFAIKTNQIRTEISQNIIQLVENISVDHFIEDMRSGSHNQIIGTEGFDQIIKKYIKNLIDDVEKNIIPQYIDQYCDMVQKHIADIFRSEFMECTIDLQNILIQSFEEICQTHKVCVSGPIITMLHKIANYPRISDDHYSDLILKEESDERNNEIRIYLLKFKEYPLLRNYEEIALYFSSPPDQDIYSMNAKRAVKILKYNWKEHTNKICDFMNGELSTMEQNIRNSIEQTINDFQPKQYIENETVEKRRELLLEIKNMSKIILRQL